MIKALLSYDQENIQLKKKVSWSCICHCVSNTVAVTETAAVSQWQ